MRSSSPSSPRPRRLCLSWRRHRPALRRWGAGRPPSHGRNPTPGGLAAAHYGVWTSDLVRRIEREHRNPYWSGPGRLVKVALGAGLTFELAYVEYPAGRGRERRLKNQGSAYRRCPLCRGTGSPLDPAAAAATLLQVAGAQ
jgi:hypothetical protein